MAQPFLNGLSIVVRAPLQCWSAPDGQVDAGPARSPGATGAAPAVSVQGVYCGDDRIADRVVLRVLGHELAPAGTASAGGGKATYRHVVRVEGRGVDPSVVLVRERQARATGMAEVLRVRTARPGLPGAASGRVSLALRLRIRPDAATMADIKAGAVDPDRPRPGVALEPGLARWTWRPDGAAVTLTAPGAVVRHDPATGEIELGWTVVVDDGEEHAYGWSLTCTDPGLPFVAAPERAADPLRAVPTRCAGSTDALTRLLATAGADLGSLRMTRPDAPGDAFLAAGSPWYLTLFGRDSLIAARLLLPYDLATALGTLRTLARSQGTRTDPDTAEQPGKILHEVRRVSHDLHDSRQAGHAMLPPVYYGTIDATCLWILLLADTWRVGAATTAIRSLLPNLRAAATWITDYADADGDGFIEYHDLTGRGLANQGWKDSGDAVRWVDGSLATAPIALCEVQGYAYAASRAAARVLRELGSAGDHDQADRLDEHAAHLAGRFRDRFWTRDARGRYPIFALDGQKRPVDGVASNMGHLLGTGILTHDEAEVVVARLLDPTMFSGYGIRTLSTDNPGYWPLGYHVGSVWTHDTAVIIAGMLAEGCREQARIVAAGLLRAAEGFDYRLPELFGGQAAEDGYPPWPYPASCRPQAWAAASAVVIARALGDA